MCSRSPSLSVVKVLWEPKSDCKTHALNFHHIPSVLGLLSFSHPLGDWSSEKNKLLGLQCRWPNPRILWLFWATNYSAPMIRDIKGKELFCFLCPRNNCGNSETGWRVWVGGFLEELFWCPAFHTISIDLVIQKDNCLEGMKSQGNEVEGCWMINAFNYLYIHSIYIWQVCTWLEKDTPKWDQKESFQR